MGTRLHFFMAMSLMLVITGPSHAAYKWVDEEGNVHYSQTRPADVSEAETIKPPPEPKSEKALIELREDQRQSTLMENEREKKRIEDLNRKNLAENKKGNCERTRKILEQLQSYERVKTVGADGVVRWASDEEKAAQIEQARQNVKQWCD